MQKGDKNTTNVIFLLTIIKEIAPGSRLVSYLDYE
jgi:hypothetical protein